MTTIIIKTDSQEVSITDNKDYLTMEEIEQLWRQALKGIGYYGVDRYYNFDQEEEVNE